MAGFRLLAPDRDTHKPARRVAYGAMSRGSSPDRVLFSQIGFVHRVSGSEDWNMDTTSRCPECHAAWRDGLTCRDHFNQMLAWEFENPAGAGAVHHLTVLCYNLQHPSVYSPEGLAWAQAILVQFLAHGVSPQQLRQQLHQTHDSGKRTYKVTGTPESEGAYAFPVHWTMTIGDVAASGLEGYCDRVRAWAVSVYEALGDSGDSLPV